MTLIRKDICPHDCVQLTRMTFTNGQQVIAEQCLDCGHRTSNNYIARKNCSTHIDDLPAWNEQLREQSRREYAEQKEREKKAWWAWYSRYLQSNSWKSLRSRILRRDRWCSICSKRRSVQAHHLTYERAGEEWMEDLAGVCVPCHEEVHKKR